MINSQRNEALNILPHCGHTRIMGKGRLYSKTFFYLLLGFIKGVSGGCFVLINK